MAGPDYGYRLPRRSLTGAVPVALLGGLAVLAVLVSVAVALFGGRAGEPRPGAVRVRQGSRRAALAGPLYRSGSLPGVGCRLPRIGEHDPNSMLRFLTTLSNCLDREWAGQFTHAGIRGFTLPQRVFWDASGTSPCGSYPAPGASAFYCPVNDTIYVGVTNVVATAGGEPVSHYAVYARIVAHEYSHHVQEDAGILGYGDGLMAGTAQPAARYEVSRRIELQAQCFAGAFLSAERGTLPMTRAQYRAVLADSRLRGDEQQPGAERDHGSGSDYAGWVARGYQERALSACNTWTASSAEVS